MTLLLLPPARFEVKIALRYWEVCVMYVQFHQLYPVIVTFAIFVFTHPDFGDFFRLLISGQNRSGQYFVAVVIFTGYRVYTHQYQSICVHTHHQCCCCGFYRVTGNRQKLTDEPGEGKGQNSNSQKSPSKAWKGQKQVVTSILVYLYQVREICENSNVGKVHQIQQFFINFFNSSTLVSFIIIGIGFGRLQDKSKLKLIQVKFSSVPGTSTRPNQAPKVHKRQSYTPRCKHQQYTTMA